MARTAEEEEEGGRRPTRTYFVHGQQRICVGERGGEEEEEEEEERGNYCNGNDECGSFNNRAIACYNSRGDWHVRRQGHTEGIVFNECRH